MPEDNPNLETVFIQALQKQSDEELTQYLDQACASDSDLRKQVESMLAVQGRLGEFLNRPALAVDEENAALANDVESSKGLELHLTRRIPILREPIDNNLVEKNGA